MTPAEKIEVVKSILNDERATNELISVMLNKAESAIRYKMYPFRLPKDENGDDITFVVPTEYEYLQCDLAVRYFSRMGGEGEILHIENGIDRHYGSANDEDLLAEVMQVIV